MKSRKRTIVMFILALAVFMGVACDEGGQAYDNSCSAAYCR